MSPGSMRNPTVVFRGPGVVEFEDRPRPTPGRGEVLLRTRRTLISSGTELTILSGDFALGSAWDGYGQFRSWRATVPQPRWPGSARAWKA
jgi:hypothetical protein